MSRFARRSPAALLLHLALCMGLLFSGWAQAGMTVLAAASAHHAAGHCQESMADTSTHVAASQGHGVAGQTRPDCCTKDACACSCAHNIPANTPAPLSRHADVRYLARRVHASPGYVSPALAPPLEPPIA